MNSLTRWLGAWIACLMVGGTVVWAQEAGEESSAATLIEDPAEPMAEEPAAGEAEEPAVAVAAPTNDSGLISVDFKDADIRQVLRIISIKGDVDIVAGNDVEGLVTIKLTRIPWEQSLDIILRTYGFTYERRGRIIRVMTMEALEMEALATEVYPLNYAIAADVPNIVNEMLSDRGRIRFDARTNTVIVTDVPSSLFQIREVIARIDQRTPQVMIQTRIVETKLEKNDHLGFRWSDALSLAQSQTALASSFPFAIGTSLGEFGKKFIGSQVPEGTNLAAQLTGTSQGDLGIGTLTGPQLSVTLNLLKERLETKILSNPSLAVLNNHEARIHIGEEFPVPKFSVDPQTGNTIVSGFEARTIGTILVVTPHVNPAREIVVDLAPEVVSVGANATFQIGANATNTVSLPRFNTQSVTTQVRIASGDTIVIGGLVKTIEITQDNKVPFLGDIPIIGALFRNKHRFGGTGNPTLQQDLLIFLTVTLMDDDPGSIVRTTGP